MSIPIAKNQIVTFTAGEYSDFDIKGIVRACHEFDLADIYAGYKKAIRPQNQSPHGFLGYLTKAGLIEDIQDEIRIHLGDYDEVTPTVSMK